MMIGFLIVACVAIFLIQWFRVPEQARWSRVGIVLIAKRSQYVLVGMVALAFGGPWFALATSCLIFLASRELVSRFYAMHPDIEQGRFLTIMAGFFALTPWVVGFVHPLGFTILLVLIATLILVVRQKQVAISLYLLMLMGLAMLAMIPSAFIFWGVQGEGTAWPLFALSVMWAGMELSLIFSRLLAQKRMFPKIEPALSWEGVLLGLVTVQSLSLLFRWLLALPIAAQDAMALALILFCCGLWGERLSRLLAQDLGDGKDRLPFCSAICRGAFVAPGIYLLW